MVIGQAALMLILILARRPESSNDARAILAFCSAFELRADAGSSSQRGTLQQARQASLPCAFDSENVLAGSGRCLACRRNADWMITPPRQSINTRGA
jgi:hypothetical protein